MVIGLWAGRLPLAQPYGEASYYMQCSSAIAGVEEHARWLLTGHEASDELGALTSRSIPSARPRMTWPPRRLTVAMHLPRLEWQYRDLSLIHFWTTKGAAPTRRPYVLTILDGMALSGQFGERGDVPAARQLAQNARAVMTLTRESAELVGEALDLAAERLVVLGAGVETSRFSPTKSADDDAVLARHRLDPGYVFYAGGWAPRKGLETLAQALISLDRERRPVLVLSGRPRPNDGPLVERVRGAGAMLLGYVPEGDMPALFRNASAVVLPSLAEGFGLPVIEAQACGVPVLASDLPVIRSVSGGHCVLVPPGDALALANALTQLPDRGSPAVAAGLTNARLHSWDEVARRVTTVYERALAGV